MVEFFSRRFEYRYPWVKYDQIAMPNYPIGAMEHTGVTGHNASVLRHLVDLEILQVQPIVEGQGLFRLPVRINLATGDKTWQETVWVEEAETRVLLPAAEKPLMVSFDGDGDLVAEIDFNKTAEELAFQAMHDAVAGRLRALRQLATRYPTRPETLATLSTILLAPKTPSAGSVFWALQAEAAQLLGEVRTAAAEELAVEALGAADYRIRKAAVLALARFGTESAASHLLRIVREDPHSDVVGTAIVALARIDPDLDEAILVEQLRRESWHDEIRIAVLQAFAELERAELLPHVRPYAEGLYNEDLRQMALDAWVGVAPTDKRLHDLLVELADSPFYSLQQYAMEKLGELYVTAAEPLLEEYVAGNYDDSLTQLAKEALEEIRRLTD